MTKTEILEKLTTDYDITTHSKETKELSNLYLKLSGILQKTFNEEQRHLFFELDALLGNVQCSCFFDGIEYGF